MAIIANIETVIKIDGEALKEYRVEHDNDPDKLDSNRKARPLNAAEARNFIEVQEGTHFSIKYRLLPGYDFGRVNTVIFELHIDGRKIDRLVVSDEKSDGVNGREAELSGNTYRDGRSHFIQRFRFGQLPGNEDLQRSHDSGKEYDFGEILVTAWLCECSRKGRSKSSRRADGVEVASAKTVHGKGVELCAQFADAEKSRERGTWHCHYQDKEPRATFVFYYRSTDVLKKLGVIGIVPPLRERPIKDLDIKRARHLLQEYNAQQDDSNSPVTEEMSEGISNRIKQLEENQSQNEDDESDVEEIPRPNQFKQDKVAYSYDEIL